MTNGATTINPGAGRAAAGRPRPGQRQLRVGEEIRHALAKMLRAGEWRDPALQDASITVTEVRMSPDLRNGTVFVMPLAGANADEVLAGLKRSARFPEGAGGARGAVAQHAKPRVRPR